MVQRNTFDITWRLWLAGKESHDGGWVHGSAVAAVPNFSLSIGRVVRDYKKVAGIDDLIEWSKGKGRLRLCIPSSHVSYEEGFMKLDHTPLLALLGA